MTPDWLASVFPSFVGLVGVIAGAFLTTRTASRTEDKKLALEREKVERGERSAKAEAFKREKREIFVAFLAAHTKFWEMREALQQDMAKAVRLGVSDEQRIGEKQMDLFRQKEICTALALEIALYDSDLSIDCRSAFLGAPIPPDLRGKNEDEFDMEQTRGQIVQVISKMHKSLGL